MPLPLAKLASVAARQLAKPVATWLQRRAAKNPSFRNICLRLGTRIHNFEYRTVQRFYDRKISSAETIPPLDEDRYITLGTTMIGEVFLFSVATFALLAEYQRGLLKEAAKEQRLQATLAKIQMQIAHLNAANHSIGSNSTDGHSNHDHTTIDAKSVVASVDNLDNLEGAAHDKKF